MILLILVLAFEAVPVKAQSVHLTTSHYANSSLTSNGSWDTWSDWTSSPGEISEYDDFFVINFKNEEFFIDILDKMEMEIDKECYFHRIFDCFDRDDYDCQIHIVIDPLDSKIVRCELW